MANEVGPKATRSPADIYLDSLAGSVSPSDHDALGRLLPKDKADLLGAHPEALKSRVAAVLAWTGLVHTSIGLALAENWESTARRPKA